MGARTHPQARERAYAQGRARSGEVPVSQQLSTYDQIQAQIVPVDRAVRDSEGKWGAGRLVTLLQPSTLEAWARGWRAWNEALSTGDLDAVVSLAPKIIAALRFMDAEATAAGHQALAVTAWETALEDGRVLCVVRTAAEAHALASTQAGRALVVWTMEELARVIPKLETLYSVKAAFPGALVQRVLPRDSGHAHGWVSNDKWQRMHDEDAQALARMGRDAEGARA